MMKAGNLDMLKNAFTSFSTDFARPSRGLPLALWLGVMILTPVAQWIWDTPGFIWMTNLGVVAQVVLVLSILRGAVPPDGIFRLLGIVLPLTWLIEFSGHTTGLPFGAYHYTGLLKPQLGGVPLLIPLAWLMMLPPAWAVAARLANPSNRLIFAALSGLVFTAWDLYLDPQMVSNKLWVWEQPGQYFGIPLLNFFGWWLASTLITLIAAPRGGSLLSSSRLLRPLGWIYTLVWLLQLVGLGIFWAQPLPALCGFLAMGLFSVLFWCRERRG
jgi:putative membrane protein